MPAARYDVVMVGFVTGHGGDALQMLTLAEGLKRVGVRSKLVVPAQPESVTFAERCTAAGIECTRTPGLVAGMNGAKQSALGVARVLHGNRAPLLHLHTGNSYLPRTAMLCLELLRPPHVVATLQSPYETLVPGAFRARTWATLANRRLDAVISPSEHGTRFQQLCGVDPPRTATIRNAVDVSRFSTGNPSGPRAQLGLRPDDPVVLFSSRIDPQKRPVDAVEMFSRVAAKFPRAHLVFAGAGSETDAVRRAAETLGVTEKTHLVGYQTNISDWLALATVCVLPTERENFSVAVLETLAAGCALIATDCPGNDEVLIDNNNSVTFPVGNIVAGAAGLARLLADPVLRDRLGAEARRTASRFSGEQMTNNVLALYQGILHDTFPSVGRTVQDK